MKEGTQPGSEGVAALIREPAAWEDVKAQAIFHLQLMTYCDEHFWTKNGSTESRLIQGRCRALVKSYQTDLDEVLQQRNDVKVQLSMLMAEQASTLQERGYEAGDETQRAFYSEAHSQSLRIAKHLEHGGYGELVKGEGWE